MMATPNCISVKPLPGITGSVLLESGSARVEERVPYEVIFDGLGSTMVMACNTQAQGLPGISDWRGGLWCVGYEPKMQAEDFRRWRIEVIYRAPKPGEAAAPALPDDVDGSRWAIDVAVNSCSFEAEVQRDKDGHMIENTAGDAIAGVMVEMPEQEITINFTTNIVDWAGINACMGPLGRGCKNSVDVVMTIRGVSRTFTAGTLRFMGFTENSTIDPSGETYTRMTYRLKWRPNGWVRQIENKGLNFGDGAGGKIPIKDNYGDIQTTPQYLNNAGTGTLTIGTSAVLLPFDLIEDYDLGAQLLWDLNS